MPEANDMTPEQLRALAEQKEIEDANKSIRTATLAHDLYGLDYEQGCYLDDIQVLLEQNAGVISIDCLESHIEDLRKSFKVRVKKGTKFCSMECYGDERWYEDPDEGEPYYGLEALSNEWAEKHLENIEEAT